MVKYLYIISWLVVCEWTCTCNLTQAFGKCTCMSEIWYDLHCFSQFQLILSRILVESNDNWNRIFTVDVQMLSIFWPDLILISNLFRPLRKLQKNPHYLNSCNISLSLSQYIKRVAFDAAMSLWSCKNDNNIYQMGIGHDPEKFLYQA